MRKKHEVRGERKEYEGTGRTIVLTVGILLNHYNQTDYICEREWGRRQLLKNVSSSKTDSNVFVKAYSLGNRIQKE